jgi:hypothetical protein
VTNETEQLTGAEPVDAAPGPAPDAVLEAPGRPSIDELLAAERRRRSRRRRVGPTFSAAILLVAFVLGLGSGYFLWGATPEAEAQKLEKDRVALAKQVNPDAGFELPVSFKNVGPQLISTGAIDEAQFVKLYLDKGKPLTDEQLKILHAAVDGHIKIDKSNSDFLLNFFWALGLVNKNPILETGEMVVKDGRDKVGGYASTGGWTLGTKQATELYSSVEIMKLTPEQQARVDEVSKNAYRPCCGNSTHFPDCNHGMALLGLLELMGSQDATMEQMYTAAKQVNAFWFPSQMLEVATYFKAVEGKDFNAIDGKLAVSNDRFSGSGFQQTHQALLQKGLLPQAPSGGQSCAV